MKQSLKSLFLFVALIFVFTSCSKVENQSSNLQSPPKFYNDEVLAKYSELTNAGYTLLEEGNADSAIASFEAAGVLIPEAKSTEYNIACVYGRIGETDKAFKALQKMADKGWDIPGQLYEDSDLASLVSDPRFDEIAEQSQENKDVNQATIAESFCATEYEAISFASQEEFDEWAKGEYAKLRRHGSIWYESQQLQASINYRSLKLTHLQELHKNDSTYEFALARVVEAAKLKSPYDCWGSIANLVVKESDAYLAGTVSDSGAEFVNFNAGLAYTLEVCDESDSKRKTSLDNSSKYLNNIVEGAKYYGAAQTLLLANKLELAGEDKMQYKDEVRATLASHAGEAWVNRIVSTRFVDDAVNMLWPIELGLNDLDNKAVMLNDYNGKVLLIDFWATWCGPCRAELPNVVTAYEKYHDDGFEIVSISLDYEDRKPLEDYKEWIAENKMNWRHIYDGKGWGAELVSKYFVSGIPAAFIIGKDGNIFAQGDDCRGENLAVTLEKALAM